MTPVTQTKLVDRDGYGTCWTACLASLLDLPEVAVPHFASGRYSEGPESDIEATVNADAPLGWWPASLGWLWMMGHRLWIVDPSEPDCPDHYLIASGLSPRSPGPDGKEIHHAVIYARQPDGSYALAHDPYPGGEGLVGEPTRFEAIRPIADEVPA